MSPEAVRVDNEVHEELAIQHHSSDTKDFEMTVTKMVETEDIWELSGKYMDHTSTTDRYPVFTFPRRRIHRLKARGVWADSQIHF